MVLKRIIFAVGAIAVVAFYAALAFLIPLRTGAGEPARAGRVDADTFLALAADAIDLCTVAGVESFLDEAAFDHEFTQSVVVDTSGGPVTNPVSRFRQAAQAEELWYWLNRAVARCTPTSTPDEFGLSVPQASADWVRLRRRSWTHQLPSARARCRPKHFWPTSSPAP